MCLFVYEREDVRACVRVKVLCVHVEFLCRYVCVLNMYE
jgi:hypothetical protein